MSEKMQSSVLQNPKDKSCFLCSRLGSHKHHVIEGKGRREQSEKYGLYILLCPWCHSMVHSKPNQGIDLELKQMAERKFLETHSMDEWREAFMKNYLEDRYD